MASEEDVEMTEAGGCPDPSPARSGTLAAFADGGVYETGLNRSLNGRGLYAIYLKSARVRYLFGFVLLLVTLLIFMVSFIMSILFSVLVPSSRDADDKWEGRAAGFLTSAPIVLVAGAWAVDAVVGLAYDAAAPGVLLRFRQRFAAAIHLARNYAEIEATLCAGCDANDPLAEYEYSGPALRRSTLVAVSCVVPVVVELASLAGLAHGLVQSPALASALSGYMGLLSAGLTLVTLIELVIDPFSRGVKFRAVHRWIVRSSPSVEPKWVADGRVEAAGEPRPSTLGRSLRTEQYWHDNELRARAREQHGRERAATLNAASRGKAKIVASSSGGASSEAAAKVARRSCWQRTRDGYARVKSRFLRVHWAVRLVLAAAFYLTVAMLTAFGVIPFGVGMSLVCVACTFFGLLWREVMLDAVGYVYTSTLWSLVVFALVLMLTAVGGLQPNSKLSIGAGTGVDGGTEASGAYLACRADLDAGSAGLLDLAILARISYAADDAQFESQLAAAFSTPALSFTTLSESEDDAIIKWRALESNTGFTVLAVRGTSTTLEAYEDLLLYSGVVLWQAANIFLPLRYAIPDVATRHLFNYLSLSAVSAPASWRPADDEVKRLLAEGRTVLLTGHSLGGGISNIVGARNSVRSVGFAPPGVFYQRERFGIDIDSARLNNLAVIMSNDLVPHVDEQVGAVQPIRCPVSGAIACHSMSKHVCAIYYACGDPRGRNLDDYCRAVYS